MATDELLFSDIELHEGEHGGAVVLQVRGVATDPGPMVRLAHQLLDRRVDGGHVVLDLRGLVVDDPASVCALFARLGAASHGVPIPTVVPDPGLRRLLRACGSGTAGLALFATLDEACDVARPALALS